MTNTPQTPQNYPHILFKSLTINGFIVSNLEAKHGAAFYADIPARVASGEIKYLEYTRCALERMGEVLLDVLTGSDTGKAVIIVADE